MHTKRLRLSKKVESLLKTNFKNKLFKTKISRNVRLAEAQMMENLQLCMM